MNPTVLHGALLAAIPIAVLAGLASFFSPCVLPLVPGYLSYVTGFSAADLADAEGRRRGRIVLGALLFVLGFTAVFVSLGGFFGFFGNTLLADQKWITRVAGVLVILLGLTFIGLMPGFTQRELRSHRKPAMGLLGAPLLGVVFGLGWVPCVSPTLAAVQTLSTLQGSYGRGALLGFAYCVGLGLPFIVAAVAFRKALSAFGWVKKHYQLVMRIGGGMLVLVGVLLLTGAWAQVTNQLQYWVSNYQVGI